MGFCGGFLCGLGLIGQFSDCGGFCGGQAYGLRLREVFSVNFTWFFFDDLEPDPEIGGAAFSASFCGKYLFLDIVAMQETLGLGMEVGIPVWELGGENLKTGSFVLAAQPCYRTPNSLEL